MERTYFLPVGNKKFLQNIPFGRIAGFVATLALILCVLFTLLSQIAHPAYNPLQDTISDLVWGAGGWLQAASFYLLAFSVIITGARLYLRANTSISYKLGVIALFLMGIGTIVVSLHPTDLPGTVETLTGIIHMEAAGTLVFLLPIACFLMAPHLGKHFKQKWMGRYTYLAGGVSVALIAVIAVLVLGDHGFLGTLERLIMSNGLIWVQIMNIQML